MARLAGRVALVSGGGTGIGRATARAICSDGGAVVVMGRRAPKLEAVVTEIREAGGRGTAFVGDVRNEEDVTSAVDTAVNAYGGLDIVVHCAGERAKGGVQETTPATWDSIMTTNLRGAFLLAREAAQKMRAGGSIVNVSSIASIRTFRDSLAYSVSKAGLNMLTQCVALELSAKTIRVNAVLPGIILGTDAAHRVPGLASYLADGEAMANAHPIGRAGTTEEIAGLIVFLCSAEASWVTGALYTIDGGRSLLSAR